MPIKVIWPCHAAPKPYLWGPIILYAWNFASEIIKICNVRLICLQVNAKTEVNMDSVCYRQSKHTSIGADFHFQMSNTDRPWYWLLKNFGDLDVLIVCDFTGRWAGNLAEKSQRGQSSEADGHGSEWCASWALGRSERTKTSAGGFSISITLSHFITLIITVS